MKNIQLLFGLLCLTNFISAQRYLTPVFDQSEISFNIEYGTAINYLGEQESLKLDFYEPKDDLIEQRPLIVYAHGGGFVDQTQTKNLVHIAASFYSFARRGYVVASIDYRLDDQICNRAIVNAMHDMRATIRYFKKESAAYRIDTSVIVVAGESAGAITSLATAYNNLSEEVLFPTDAPQAQNQTVEGLSGSPGFTSSPLAVMCLCGGTQTIVGEALFSPLSMNTLDDPPLLQIHGTADPLIHIVDALEISTRASEIDLPFLFFPLDGATHCPWYFPLENSWAYLDTLIDLTVPFLFAATGLSTSIEEVHKGSDFALYPNPSNGRFYIQKPEHLAGKISISIYDQNATRFYANVFGELDHHLIVETNLGPGFYILNIESDFGKQSFKVVIK